MFSLREKTLNNWSVGDPVRWAGVEGLGIVVAINHYMVWVWWASDQRVWPHAKDAFQFHAEKP